MPSVIDEHTQFLDESTGIPIVNGKVYIGLQNNDPKANLITIYSDRDLSIVLANPQPTDSAGRTVNKIWVPGKYSVQADDSNDVQKYQELDNGELTQTGITRLTNVQGTDSISADGVPAVTVLVDQQQYVFRAANAPTGAVTLQIDTTPAKAIKKRNNIDIVADDWDAGQIVTVVFDETDDVYEMTSAQNTGSFGTLVVDNLTVTTSATVGGEDVVNAPIATSHIRAGNTQLINGDITITPEAVSLDVIEDTWESYGPTGSGADNIWEDMDLIDPRAKVIVADIGLSFSTFDIAPAALDVYVVSGDIVSPTKSANNNRIAALSYDPNSASASIGQAVQVKIPLDGSQVFKVLWEGTNEIGASVGFRYRGFITD